MSARRPPLIGWLLWLTGAAIWSLLVWLWLLEPTPIVSRTWPDGACVAVEPARWSCDDVPSRYETAWVGGTETP